MSKEAKRRIEEAKRTGARMLNLSYLKLTALPESIRQLTALTTLYLRGNQVQDVGQIELMRKKGVQVYKEINHSPGSYAGL